MIICESCGHKNFEGLEECEECQTPLDDNYLVEPTNSAKRSLLKDRISVLQPKKPITVESTATVQEVMQTLVDKQIGCAVVVESGKTVGIFSERDVLIRLNVDTPNLKDRPIADFMTSNPRHNAWTWVATAMYPSLILTASSTASYRHVTSCDTWQKKCRLTTKTVGKLQTSHAIRRVPPILSTRKNLVLFTKTSSGPTTQLPLVWLQVPRGSGAKLSDDKSK